MSEKLAPTSPSFLLMTSFINSQFQFCPLAWMFNSRKLNTEINKLHERALRITYRDQESSFEDLLGYDNSVSVHQKNLQVLMIEMFKTKHGLNPPVMKEIFCPQTNYSLRNDRDFNLPRARDQLCLAQKLFNIEVLSFGVHFQFQLDTQLT